MKFDRSTSISLDTGPDQTYGPKRQKLRVHEGESQFALVRKSLDLKSLVRRGLLFAGMVLMSFSSPLFAQVDPEDDLISLDSLLNMRISSASKYEQSTSEAPASVTIVTRDEIRQYGYQDLSELLNQVRDLYISFDRDYTYLGVRGFSRPTDYNNRIGVMVNGSLVNENMWGIAPVGAEFMGLNIDMVERVEFIRGPGSALYGNSPMLGLLNIVTSNTQTLEGLQVSAEAGSFGKLQTSLVFGKALNNGMNISASGRLGKVAGQNLYFPEYDDSSTNYGIAEKRDWAKYGGFTTQIAWRGFTWQAVYSNRMTGLATGSFDVLFNNPDSRNSDKYGMTELKWERDLSSRVAFAARAYGNYFQNQGQYPYDSTDGGLVQEQTLTLYGGAEARVRCDISDNNRLVAGVEGIRHFNARYSQVDNSSVLWAGNFPFSTLSVYAQDEYQPFKWLSLTLGGRYDHLYLGRQALTPRLAALFFPRNGTTVKLMYGEAFRSPTVYEYNVDDPIYARPNFDLKSERIRTMELNVAQRISKELLLNAAGFYNRMTNLIDQVEDEVDGLIQYQNVGKAEGFGASAEIVARVEPGIQAYANYSYQHMRDAFTDQPLTNSPAHLAKLGASVRWLRHFRASMEGNLQSGRVTLQGNTTDPFLYLTAQLGIEPNFPEGNFLNRIHAYFKVRNLLNSQYGFPGGYEHRQDIIIQNGRTFNIKLQVEIF